jgi:hypothetical protein
MAQLPSGAHPVATTTHMDPARVHADPVGPASAPFEPASVSPSVIATQGAVCGQCGGSGRLRINDDSFRTCLDCLGQGVLSHFGPSPQLADWIAPRTIGRI